MTSLERNNFSERVLARIAATSRATRISILAVAALIFFVFFFRYDVQPTAHESGGLIIRLDRLTGEIALCRVDIKDFRFNCSPP